MKQNSKPLDTDNNTTTRARGHRQTTTTTPTPTTAFVSHSPSGKPANLRLYCPAAAATDETDLTSLDNGADDSQQVSLLDYLSDSAAAAAHHETNGHRGKHSAPAARSDAKGKQTTSTFTFASNMLGGAKNGQSTTNQQQQQQQQQMKLAKKAAVSAAAAAANAAAANQKRSRKNILSAGDDQDDQDLESQESKLRHRSRRLKWTLATLMGLLVVLFLVVIGLLSFTSLLGPDDGSPCQNQPFQPPNNRLFSTKTLYSTALNYLSLMPPTPPPQVQLNGGAPTAASLISIQPSSLGADPKHRTTNANNNPQAQQQQTNTNADFNYDKSSIYRPKFFSPNYTLASLHEQLTQQQGCEARQFYLIGRHAARLPSEHEIERLTSAVESIKKRIDLIISQSSQSSSPAADQRQPQSSSSVYVTSTTTQLPGVEEANGAAAAAAGAGAANHSSATGAGLSCFDPLLTFSQWNMFAKPKQGNLITGMGALETQELAKRFARLYPNLFDGSMSSISIGVTNEIRTAQTAVNFLKGVNNLDRAADLRLPCELDKFPLENDVSDYDHADTINEDRCYRNLRSQFSKSELSFHKGPCKSLPHHHPNVTARASEFTRAMRRSVSRKLRMNQDKELLSHEDVMALYDLCKYETSLTGHASVWCSLFSEQDLKLLAYMTDIKDFYDDAYGNPQQAMSACALTNDLIDNYMSIDDDQEDAPKRPPRRAQFHFTHSAAIQKLIAASVDLTNDPAYEDQTVLANLESGTVPKEREWQTSLLTPFSANIAFTLYECPLRPPTAAAAASTQQRKPLAPPPTQGASHSDVAAAAALVTQPPAFSLTMDVRDSPSTFKVVTSLNEQPILVEGCADYACKLKHFYARGRLARFKGCKQENICPK